MRLSRSHRNILTTLRDSGDQYVGRLPDGNGRAGCASGAAMKAVKLWCVPMRRNAR